MKRSTERILTTFGGSLPRPKDLQEMIMARQVGQSYDQGRLDARMKNAVAEAVRDQADAGVDIVSDGEQGKTSFIGYAGERLAGFEQVILKDGQSSRPVRSDWVAFKDFYEEYWKSTHQDGGPSTQMTCTKPITYTGQAAVQNDIDTFRAALADVNVEESFIPAISPGTFGRGQNEYYPDDESFYYAIADAMKEEYKAIIDAGFVLQIDDPGLPDTWDLQNAKMDEKEYHEFAELRIDALNHALEGLPTDRIRYHICWGSWHGPHTTDIPLKDVLDLVLKVNAGAYYIEAANPRHEHEWKLWQDGTLPDGKILVPGVVAHVTNHIEHPELVADRIVRFANIVGKENVIAATDCGFSQGALNPRLHPSIVWAKLRTLAEGAALATKQLWH